MPIHFPEDLFNDDEDEELALQVISKLRAKKVLKENAEYINQITHWFAADDSDVSRIIKELVKCPDADVDETFTGRIYLTEEFLENPDVGYTTFGDDP